MNGKEQTVAKISIIIPVYNAQSYIEACIESVRRQTLQDLEILCVDDGSTDGSLAILHSMREADERIHIEAQENQGAGKARNVALEQANGEYVLFLDADDYLLDVSALERMYDACMKQGALICGAFRSCERDGIVTPMSLHREACQGYPGGRRISYRDYQYDFHFGTYLYRRELLIEHQIFFPDYRRFQDPPFLVKAMVAAGAFYVVPVELYCFRVGHQDYAFSPGKVNDIVRGMIEILEISAAQDLRDLHLLEVGRLNEGYFWHIVRCLRVGNGELLSLLDRANHTVQWQWVEDAYGESERLLKALRFLLQAGQERYERYCGELEQKGYRDIPIGAIFPFHKIPPQSKIVLYAAGVMGWTYYGQIKDNPDYVLTGWVDRQYEKYAGHKPVTCEGRELTISSVESIGGMDFDYVVIAIEEERTALEIMASMKALGVPGDKIVWSLSYE